MYFRLFRNEVRKKPLVSLASLLFVCAAALLVSLAAILAVNLAGAVDAMMNRGKTPHFMQMHAGTLDAVRLESFARQHPAVAEYQLVEFLNLDGAQFVFGRSDGSRASLAASIQDNGLVLPSERFDLLLDLDGRLILPEAGTVYIPIAYWQEGLAEVGDSLTIAGRPFRIAGVLRDSQMQSMLASSKRFLVHPDDLSALRSGGSIEYLVQFRLHGLEQLGAFAADYTAAGLEANGPAVTYPLFRMMNGLSDGLMIALILLISVLVLLIAFMCIRFTLLAKIEDDYREIGVMKAIGLRLSDIKKIYLVQYLILAATGCIAGYLLSLLFRDALLANIRLYMGSGTETVLAFLVGAGSVILVFLAVWCYLQLVLRRFRRITPAQAVRFGMAQEQKAGGRTVRLRDNGLFDINLFLGVKDVLSRKALYSTMLVVLILAAFIIIVPQNLHTTVSSRSFVRYMGIAQADIYLGIQQTENIGQKTAEMAALLSHDPEVRNFVVSHTVNTRVLLADGTEERLLVELADHSVFPLAYNQGRAPAGGYSVSGGTGQIGSDSAPGSDRSPALPELALSVLSADSLGLGLGDTVTLWLDGEKVDFLVCGIYSDVTNGGRTAKASIARQTQALMWSTVAAALSMALLIILLFMRLLVAKDRYAIAVLKACGFTNGDIRRQYLARSLFVLVLAVVSGTLLANTLGEALAGALISSFGVASFNFIVNPIHAYVLSPLGLAAAVVVATVLGSLDAGRIAISENLKEA